MVFALRENYGVPPRASPDDTSRPHARTRERERQATAAKGYRRLKEEARAYFLFASDPWRGGIMLAGMAADSHFLFLSSLPKFTPVFY